MSKSKSHSIIITKHCINTLIQGDSGGPLLCETEGKWYLAGIISWSVGCAEIGHPDIFADTQYFIEWIKSNTGLSKNKLAHTN